MSEFVTILREEQRVPKHDDIAKTILREAADRIEALEAEVERLTAGVERWAGMYQHLADATERLRADLATARAQTLDAIANRVSAALPDFCEVNIAIENGAAWVTLTRDGHNVPLPDTADRTLVEQVDATLAALPPKEDS